MPTPPSTPRIEPDRGPVLAVIATVHLDTQWRWTIEDTIRDFLPATLERNFELLDRYPWFVLSFEGAFRYQLMEEYYPREFHRLREYVREGRWQPAGSMLDSPDVNEVSPESLLRHILYAQRYFDHTFGRTSNDLFLPDCFGFGRAVPSIAAHCGVLGFSAQKFGNWMAPASIPFDLGWWRGPDGRGVVAALRPEGYGEGLSEDLSSADRWIQRTHSQGRETGAATALMYVGVGDRGGGLDDESVRWLEQSVGGEGPLRVAVGGSGQLFQELKSESIARFEVYDGELLLPRHGTGCHTSQAEMKRWNRRNEQLAAAAECAAVLADCRGGLPYPSARLRDLWQRFLWHQMHDDLTGTSIPEAYRFSWNDQALAANGFADILVHSLEALSAQLDTRHGDPEAVPLVVFNPLSFPREEDVEVEIPWSRTSPEPLVTEDAAGRIAPVQVLEVLEERLRCLVLARAPSCGVAVLHLRTRTSGEVVEALPPVEADESGRLANDQWLCQIGVDGFVESLRQNPASPELLSGPAQLQLLPDRSVRWPAWEILHEDVSAAAEPIAGFLGLQVVETGPLRAAVQVRWRHRGSTYTQTIRAATGAARVDLHCVIDWRTRGKLLKAAFPTQLEEPRATYDLGLGVVHRGVNTPEKYEVPAQQWADLSTGDQGLSILSDGKLGWDRPDASTLRLSLLRSPAVRRKFRHQGVQDLGTHRFTYALHAHARDWSQGLAWRESAALNQPLRAFSTSQHEGDLGSAYSFLDTASRDGVLLRALKFAEDEDRVVARFSEVLGRPEPVAVRVGDRALNRVFRADGRERKLGNLNPKGNAVELDLGPFALETVTLAPPRIAPRAAPVQRTLDLPFDQMVTSANGSSNGDFDGCGHSIPAELFPSSVASGPVHFALGPVDGPNAILSAGQHLAWDDAWERLCLLVGAPSPVEAEFRVGERRTRHAVPPWSGLLAYWKGWRRGFRRPRWAAPGEPYLRREPIAWYASHRHARGGVDEPYRFAYFYRIDLHLNAEDRSAELPKGEVRLLAATLVRGLPPVLHPGVDLYA